MFKKFLELFKAKQIKPIFVVKIPIDSHTPKNEVMQSIRSTTDILTLKFPDYDIITTPLFCDNESDHEVKFEAFYPVDFKHDFVENLRKEILESIDIMKQPDTTNYV